MSRTRTRNYSDGPLLLGTEYQKSGAVYTQYTTPYTQRMIEEISDETHAGPPFRSGGGMILRRTTHVRGKYGVRLLMPGAGPQGSYSGDLLAAGTSFNSSLPTLPNFASLEAEAWNRFKPGKPLIDVGVFLGELRELPSLLRQTSLNFLRSFNAFRIGGGRHNWNHREVASAYLSYEFGWRPFIGEVKKIIQVQQRLEKAIDQLRRDNNRPIRRGGFVRSTNSHVSGGETVTGQNFAPQVFGHGFYVTGTASQQNVVSNTMRAWFSGRFRYNLPNVDGAGFRASAMIKLLGLNILDPAVVWDLMPWSWLVDWFTNVGDVLDNMSSQAAINLVADYAYLMVHSRTTTQANVKSKWHCRDEMTGSSTPKTIFGESYSSSEYKIRNSASPFGFGLDDTDLSVRQLAILSALGLSRT